MDYYDLAKTSKLSEELHSIYIEKIKDSFSEDEQRWFVANFYMYTQYDQRLDFVIDLDNIYKYLGFSTKANIKRTLIKNFIENEDYKVLLIPRDEQKRNENRGGYNDEKVMLNIETFKNMCMLAKTPEAKRIRQYYIKLEIVYTELLQRDLLLNKEKEFQKLLISKEKEYREQLNKQKEISKHKILLENFRYINGGMIYVMKVKTLDENRYVVKIGESRVGIEKRWKAHKTSYEESILLDCFVINRSKDFEKFLHDKLELYKYNLYKHENEKELFLVGENLTYNMILDIINTNINKFNELQCYEELRQLQIENEKLKQQTNSPNELEQRLIKIEDRLGNLDEKLNKLLERNTGIYTNFGEIKSTIGPKLQKINPENFLLIKVYNTVSECLEENPDYTRSSITKAIRENTIYKNFRWSFVNRNMNENIVQIKETRPTVPRQLGYVVKLNETKTEIINIYIDRKTASLKNGFQSVASLDEPVKHGRLIRGHFYSLLENCEISLIEQFMKRKQLKEIVLYYKNGVGQYDLSGKLIKEFKSKHDCLSSLPLGDKSIKKALELEIPYQGYLYKYLPEKTFL